MNKKLMTAISLMAVLAAFCILAVVPAEETDAATQNYTSKELYQGGSRTITFTENTTVVITDVTEGDDEWANESQSTFSLTNGQSKLVTISYISDNVLEGEVNVTFTVSVPAPTNYSLSFTASPYVYGSVSRSTLTVTAGTTIYVSGNTLTIGGTTVTATPTPNTAQYTYAFTGWDVSNGTVVNSSMVITASFSRTPVTHTASVTTAYGSASVAVGDYSVTASSSTLTPDTKSFTFSHGSTVKYTSGTPATGYQFDHWEYTANGSTSTTTSLNFNVTGNTDVSATCYFVEIPTYTLTFTAYNSWGTFSPVSSLTVPEGSTIYTSTNTVTVDMGGSSEDITATPLSPSGGYTYAFTSWDVPNATLVYTDMTITAYFTRSIDNFTVSFVASPSYGSFQPTDTLTVPYGSTVTVNGSTVTINSIDVSAVPNASDGTYTYSFDSWSVVGGESITSDTTITATFSRDAVPPGAVHWSNGMMNGRVSMVFDWISEDMELHNMSMLFYTGTVNPDYTTTWASTGYTLNMSLSFPNTNFSFDLQNNGTSVKTDTVTAGKWDKYELTIDAENGLVWMIPLKTFTSFLEYTTLDSQKTILFDFSQYVSSAAIDVIDHEDTGTGDHVRFSVTNTDVFLNTYGIVMNNPTINVYNYFPQYDKVRVNFYAFAIYGNSFTINGTTFTVNNGQVTVQYATDSNGNKFLPSLLPDAEVKQKTMALNNIFVTWDGSNVSLTFQSDRFTINLGQYSQNNETIAFNGLWYFTSTIYEPQTSYEKQLGEWKVLPDLDMNQMLLIFLGILALVGSVAWIKLGGGLIDAMVMAFAGIIAFILLV